MDLNQYVRTIINNKVRPIFLHTKCDHCDNTDNLHLHHVKLFSDIVNDTLYELRLDNKDTNEYTDLELNLIVNVIMGKHLQIDYLTLCPECHDLIHKKEWKNATVNNKHKMYYENRRKQNELTRELYVKNELIPYLESIINKKLEKNERIKLINKIKLSDGRGRIVKSVSLLSKYFEESNLPYRIVSKRSRKIINGESIQYRYWEVTKL